MSGVPGRRDPIRVLVVDDHAVYRRGISQVLNGEPDIEVVGEAEDGAVAVARTAALSPDVVVMDIRMPRMDGIEATRRITAGHPDVRVLMLTVSEEEEDLYAAVRAGASGYLSKAIPLDELAAAVRAVVAGQSRLSPEMARKLMAELSALAERAEPAEAPAPRLTPRELAVLRLVAQGRTNREIGVTLGISENTVKNHVRNILAKLHLHSRTDAVLYAVREGLLEVGEQEGEELP